MQRTRLRTFVIAYACHGNKHREKYAIPLSPADAPSHLRQAHHSAVDARVQSPRPNHRRTSSRLFKSLARSHLGLRQNNRNQHDYGSSTTSSPLGFSCGNDVLALIARRDDRIPEEPCPLSSSSRIVLSDSCCGRARCFCGRSRSLWRVLSHRPSGDHRIDRALQESRSKPQGVSAVSIRTSPATGALCGHA